MEPYSGIGPWRPCYRDSLGHPARTSATNKHSLVTRRTSVTWPTLSWLPPRSLGRLFRTAVLASAALAVTACATVDHNAAAGLGTAGVEATQVLSTETGGAIHTLDDLNKLWAIEGTLVCINARTPDLRKICTEDIAKHPEDPSARQLTQIIKVLNQQKHAIDTLNQAYAAFVDLVQYNAGQEATAALSTSFSDINSFLSAVSALPGVTPIPAISSTLEKVTGGIVGLIADNRQNEEILAANRDLGIANQALYEGLNAETGPMSSLLLELNSERDKLYERAFDVGIISPIAVLTPVFSDAYPGIQLQAPPAANQDVVKAAAKVVVSLKDRQASTAVISSNEAAIATLQTLQIQHGKLQTKQGINLAEIRTEVNNLRADVAQMGTTSASSTSK